MAFFIVGENSVKFTETLIKHESKKIPISEKERIELLVKKVIDNKTLNQCIQKK